MEVASQGGFRFWNQRSSRLQRAAAFGMVAAAMSFNGCQSYPGLQLSNATRVPPPATRSGAASAYYGPTNNAPSTKSTTQNMSNQQAPVVQASASDSNYSNASVRTANWAESSPARMLSTGTPMNQQPAVRTADYTDQGNHAPVVSASAVESLDDSVDNAGQRISDGRSAISGANLQWQQTR